MKSRKWNIIFFLWILMVLAGLAIFNYRLDPYGYFTFRSGDYDDIDFSFNLSVILPRYMKLNHVKNFPELHDAFLIGGSKAGAYDPAKLSELDGYSYYNMFVLGGNLKEYVLETDYLLKYAHPKKIILSLSGGEVLHEGLKQENLTYRYPAAETGKSEFVEYFSFLFKDPFQSYAKYRRRTDLSFLEAPRTGERNLAVLYKRKRNKWIRQTKRNVLGSFDEHMSDLFTRDQDHAAIQYCLDSVKSIRDKCAKAGVELTVVMAPAFIGEMSEFESSSYRDYMIKLALITDYWDFSGYHDLDLNPWNFYNEGHFYREIGDAVIDVMRGENVYEGFGTYVTRENVMDHVARRKADYERLQAEYRESGTIQLQDMDDESCLVTLPPEKTADTGNTAEEAVDPEEETDE